MLKVQSKTWLPALALGLLLLGWACKDGDKIPLQTREVGFTHEGALEILKAGTDSVRVNLDIEIAETAYETQTGLMYRKTMEDRQGMLFIFEAPAVHSFYMKNTLIPLDLLFIDDSLKIVTIRKNAAPLDESGIPSGAPVQYVLEIKGGLSDRWGIAVGDAIRFERLP